MERFWSLIQKCTRTKKIFHTPASSLLVFMEKYIRYRSSLRIMNLLDDLSRNSQNAIHSLVIHIWTVIRGRRVPSHYPTWIYGMHADRPVTCCWWPGTMLVSSRQLGRNFIWRYFKRDFFSWNANFPGASLFLMTYMRCDKRGNAFNL